MPTTFDEESANKKLMKHPPAITFAVVSATDNHSCTVRLDEIIIPDRYGSKTKLLRVTAFVVKFARLLKGGKGNQIRAIGINSTRITICKRIMGQVHTTTNLL